MNGNLNFIFRAIYHPEVEDLQIGISRQAC